MIFARGRAHEDGCSLAIIGQDLEAERLLVERGGSARVAHVENGVIEAPNSCSHDARNPLRCSTIPGKTSTNRPTSAAVDDQPTDIRSDRSPSTPMASRTGEGSSVSDEQAEPECTATPRWSRASRIGSASTPRTPMHNTFG